MTLSLEELAGEEMLVMGKNNLLLWIQIELLLRGMGKIGMLVGYLVVLMRVGGEDFVECGLVFPGMLRGGLYYRGVRGI
jgi:hypothetical protein